MAFHVIWLNAAADKKYVTQLEKFAAQYKQNGLISTWSPSHTQPGADLTESVREQILRADLVGLIVSSDLVAKHADWIEQAVQRGKEGVQVVPVLARSVRLPDALTRLVPLPGNGKPISTYRNPDVAYAEVIEGIRESLAKLTPARPASTAPTAVVAQGSTVIIGDGNAEPAATSAPTSAPTPISQGAPFASPGVSAAAVKIQDVALHQHGRNRLQSPGQPVADWSL